MIRDYSGLLIDINRLTTDVRDTLSALVARNEELERENKQLNKDIQNLHEEYLWVRADVIALRHKLDDAMEGRKK